MKGCFITFEGPEGSGKSTHVRKLAMRLRRMGHEVITTREPGGTPAGEAIREVLQHDRRGEGISPETEAMLFVASRAQIVRSLILPALKRGAWVICDRFTDSTLAYQGYGRGLSVKDLMALNTFAVNGAIPDLTLLLDVDIGLGFRRLKERNRGRTRGRDRIERENMRFHARVRKGYLELAKKWPGRIKVIAADAGPSAVQGAIWEIVRKHLKPGGR